MSDHLREAGILVAHLSRALLDGSRDLRTVPTLVKRIIADHLWREWADPASGRTFGPFNTFDEFVTKGAADGGLGSTVNQLRALCEGDMKALAAIEDQILIDHPHGGDHSSPESKNNNIQLAPQGTSQARALRKLHKDRPDLHAEVLAERLSAHSAMVRAGYRPKTVTVPVTRPEAVARSLLKHMSADNIAKLIAVLIGAGGP